MASPRGSCLRSEAEQTDAGRGEIEIPQARFLFVTFSFGKAKEKVMLHPQISNMRFYIVNVSLTTKYCEFAIVLLLNAAAGPKRG